VKVNEKANSWTFRHKWK